MLAPRLNGVGLMKSLEMREEEASQGRVERSDDEDLAAEANRVDAEALSHQARAVERAHGATDAAVEQVGRHCHDDGDGDQDDREVDALVCGCEWTEGQWWDFANAIEAVQRGQRAEQGEKRDAPCDGHQCEEVTRQARCDEAEEPGDRSSNE